MARRKARPENTGPEQPSESSIERPAPQTRLFPFENPLLRQPGADFFRSIPQTTGVYFFVGERDQILYVGKAKNLRTRLNSYKRAKPDAVSRKIIRLLFLTRAIRWEECPTEAAALLRENQLLRDLKPAFNVVNTQPETYFFLALRFDKGRVQIRLTTREEVDGFELYGSFKGRNTVREGYGSLLRLLWLTQPDSIQQSLRRFEMPARLLRYRLPAAYTVRIPDEWKTPLRRFLGGTGDAFLVKLTERLLENLEIPPFYYQLVQRDLEALQTFYDRCLKRNRALIKAHGRPPRMIPQNQLDDLMVLELVRLGRVEG